ncbi:MAG: oligosaccharide flippase family protein [Anaerolineae bacterium]|nr:oligosaccharide flippase family protein [Anaerolineae bacterium]NUQ06804.1 oligosaccharide flippase family protein [Anaerolineae bacterium]
MIERLRLLLGRRFVRDTMALQAGKLGATLLSFISSFVVWRLLGPERYGVFGLAVSFLALWHLLDLSGLGSSTASLLGTAVGANDADEARDLCAFHLRTLLLIDLALILLIALVGQPAADWMHGSPQIGDLAVWLAVAAAVDRVYALIITALQARRSMIVVAVLGMVNQLVLSAAAIIAALIDPRPEALTAARLIYSILTLGMAMGVYAVVRQRGDFVLPAIADVLRRLPSVSRPGYWRYGFANAIDKNLADVFIQIPVQIVGVVGGERAVGYLNLAMTGVLNVGILTSAIFENLKAVVPQAIGRKDYTALWRGMRGALISLAVGGSVVYAALALAAPVAIPPLLGDEWIAAIPALIALTPFGAISAVAGVFGPLYRALFLMRGAIFAKLGALLIVLLPGGVLLALVAGSAPGDAATQTAALGGALLIDCLFAIQAILTARVALPPLRRLALSTSGGSQHARPETSTP